MPGGKQSSRFEMLLNVSLGGMDKFKALGSTAKKAALGMNNLTQALDKVNASEVEAKQNIKDVIKDLEAYIKTYDKYRNALANLDNKLKASNAETKVGQKAISRAKDAVREHTKSLTRYKNAVNAVVPGLINMTKQNGKIRSQQKSLKGTTAGLKEELRKLGKANQRAVEETRKLGDESVKTSKDSKKLSGAIRENEFAVDRLRQRLKRSDIPAFRKRLGALRNQILVLTFAFGGLVRAFQRAFDEANILQSALRGLGAVAANTGNGLEASQRAALNLTENGLLTVQDAAAGLKNLLSAGFGLKEATALMNTLTDAASFNRQGTLSLGQAVVGATQGIKNQNSIMVDNAGITKNLSIMYKEYAESIGTTAGKIDEAQKRQAIFNGILKEGAVFAGDADRVLSTMSGQLAKLGTNARAAAAGVGELIQPFAMGFVAAISSGAEALKNLGDQAKDNPALQQTLVKTGYQIENAFRAVGKIFGQVSDTLTKLGTNFAGLAVTLTKVAIGYRVLFAVQNRLRAGTLKTAEAAQNMSEIFDIQSRQVIGAVNTKTGKLISQYQLLKIEILKNNEAIRERIRVEKLNIPTTDKVMKQLFKLDLTIKGVVLRTKAMVTSLANFARLARIAGQAALALGKAFGKIAVQLIAIEAIFIVVQKLIGLFGSLFESQEQIELNAARAKTANDALNKSFDGTVSSLKDVTTEAAKFANIDFTFLENQAKKLEDYKNKVNAASKALMDATSLDEQAKAQSTLDTAQGLYDNALATYKSYLMEVQAATGEHLSRIQGANTMYNEQYEKSIEHLGLKGYNDTRESYLKIEQAIEDFQKTKIHMTEKSESEILNAEQTLYNARLIALQNFESERQKLIASGLNDAVKKNEMYTAKLLDLDKSEVDRIKSSYANQLAELKKGLKAQVQAIETTLTEADKQALKMFQATQAPLNQAGKAFAKTVQPVSDPYANQGGQDYQTEVSIGDTMVRGNTMVQKQAAEVLPKVSAAYRELNDLYREYRNRIKAANGDQSKVIEAHEMMRDRMVENETTMGSLLKRVEDMGFGESKLADNLRKTNESMDTFNNAAGKQIGAYRAMTGEQSANATALKEVTDATSEAEKAAEAYFSQQEALRVSAVLYRDELKGIAATQKEVNDALQGGNEKFGDIVGKVELQRQSVEASIFTLEEFKRETFASSGKLKDLMNVFTKTDSLKSFTKNMVELNTNLGVSGSTLARQARELATFKTQQEIALQGVRDRAAAAEIMNAAEDKLLKTMEAGLVVKDAEGKIVSGQYTQADIDRQRLRTEVSEAKVNALNKEIEATKKLGETELEQFAAGQDIAAMQERIQAFTEMATKFGSFITTMQNMEQKRLNANRAYRIKIQKEIDTQVIDQEQGNALMLENAKLTNAQKELDEAKYLASLIRQVGQIIMIEGAKRAAASGNIVGAIAMFGAGLAGMAIANNAANKIEAKAQADYDKAEADFRAKEQEIRGDGEEQTTGSATGSQKFGGSIKAENLAVTISPTVVISGEQVFIGQGSVTEFGAEMQALLLSSMQDAVENREIDLTQAANLEG